jgi:serine O-acetyltransferase
VLSVASDLRRDLHRLRHKSAGRFPRYAVEAFLFDNGFQAVFFYRLARWFKRRRIPGLGPLLARWGLFLTGADLSPRAEIGPGLRISHGVGLVIGGYVRIGAGATLLHGVTIGSVSEEKIEAMPVLGDRVFVGAGAALLGGITVGDDAFVGAGAVVTRNLPAGSRVLVRQELAVDSPPRPMPARDGSPDGFEAPGE